MLLPIVCNRNPALAYVSWRVEAVLAEGKHGQRQRLQSAGWLCRVCVPLARSRASILLLLLLLLST